MKIKLLTLAILVLFTVGQTSAQSPHLFIPDTTVKWKEFDWNYNNTGVPYNLSTYVFEVAGTDDIDGKTYYKISRQWLKWDANTITGTPISAVVSGFDQYFLAVREDSGKVYRRIPGSANPEVMIYDFTAGVGDFLPNPPDGSLVNEVLAMDSILIGTEYRKTWITTIGYDCIDGVGNRFGPFNHYGGWSNYENNLVCYSVQDVNLFENSVGGSDCNYDIIPLGISSNEQEQMATISYTDQAVVVRLTNTANALQFELYNATGQLLDAGSFQSEVMFNSLDLSSGLYFLQIQGETVKEQHKIFIR